METSFSSFTLFNGRFQSSYVLCLLREYADGEQLKVRNRLDESVEAGLRRLSVFIESVILEDLKTKLARCVLHAMFIQSTPVG